MTQKRIKVDTGDSSTTEMWSLTLSIFGENIRRVLWTKCVQGTAYTGVQQLFVNCPEVLKAEDKYRTLQAMSRILVKNNLPESHMLWSKGHQRPLPFFSILRYVLSLCILLQRKGSIKMLAKIPHDCIYAALSYLTGPIRTGMFSTFNTWGAFSDWTIGNGLAFVDHLGYGVEDTGIRLWCRGALVHHAEITYNTDGTTTIEWANNENDATRATKPFKAKIQVHKTWSYFEGNCTFPGEGPVGFYGANDDNVLAGKSVPLGSPYDFSFRQALRVPLDDNPCVKLPMYSTGPAPASFEFCPLHSIQVIKINEDDYDYD